MEFSFVWTPTLFKITNLEFQKKDSQTGLKLVLDNIAKCLYFSLLLILRIYSISMFLHLILENLKSLYFFGPHEDITRIVHANFFTHTFSSAKSALALAMYKT